MLQFSKDPEVAERQMQAIIFYLTTFGYIDGEFDVDQERSSVHVVGEQGRPLRDAFAALGGLAPSCGDIVECLGCGKYGHPFLQRRNACQ